MGQTLAPTFTPPGVDLPTRRVSLLDAIRKSGVNALQMWPAEAYERETFVQTSLGRSRFLFNGEEEIHRVLVGNAKNYGRTPPAIRLLRPIVGDGLLLSQGESWRRQRQTVGPALAPRVMPILARPVVTETERLIARLARGDTGRIDVLALMQRLTLDIAARSMFSIGMEENGDALRRMMTEFGLRLGRPALFDYLLPVSLPSPRDLMRWRFRRRWMRLMAQIMASRPTVEAEAPRNLLDLMRAARDPETGAGFNDAQLCDQMATLLLAGHETTALSLFWALYLVASVPAVQARIAAEATTTDSAGEAAKIGQPGLRFTRAVVQEAMRLYPPAFTLSRQALAEDRIGDLVVPRGSTILIAPWVLHRHRRFWRDPEMFDPSRFEGDPRFAHRFAYLPFGAGPRVCVGAQFALTEATLVLAMLVAQFEIAMADGRPVRPMAIITTIPDHAASFSFRPRR